MLDERVADGRAAAGQEVQDPRRDPGLLRRIEEHRRDARRVGRGLQDHGVSGHERGRRHPREDRERKVPGRNDRADAERDVLELVLLARIGRQGLRLREALHVPRVELAEVDRLGRVAVGLGPGLGFLEHHHRGELVLAFPQDRGDAQDE